MTKKTLPPPPQPVNRLLSNEEACQILGIGKTSLANLCNTGALRAVSIGRRRLIPEAELSAYIQRLTDESR
jgi:excisionase family DNA binding protein